MSMKKGDTLIEVAIAIAIFSLVAIGVVSVVNGSTSAAQNALEVTVTREEIDTQAEAIRFIHNSYISGGQSNLANNERYKNIWQEILKYTHKADLSTIDRLKKEILTYRPETCQSLYNKENNTIKLATDKAFIINPRALGSGEPSDIVVGFDDKIFTPASTYPRLLFAENITNDDQLLTRNSANTLSKAEGIFVIAVADQGTTSIVNENGTIEKKSSAFYDFYIRTCWFAPGADRPSTVSTVIRLQDPALGI